MRDPIALLCTACSVVSTLVPDAAGGAPDVFAGMRPQQLPPQLVGA